MKRHTFDPLSFVFGVIFLFTAAAAAWDRSLRWDLGVWLVPGAVLVLGIGLLASTLRTGSEDPGVQNGDIVSKSTPKS